MDPLYPDLYNGLYSPRAQKAHNHDVPLLLYWMKRKEIYEKLLRNPKNIRFGFLCRAAERFGFTLKASRGSHHVFTRDGIPEILNLQDVNGKAKPYQVKQLCTIIGKYSLHEEEDHE